MWTMKVYSDYRCDKLWIVSLVNVPHRLTDRIAACFAISFPGLLIGSTQYPMKAGDAKQNVRLKVHKFFHTRKLALEAQSRSNCVYMHDCARTVSRMRFPCSFGITQCVLRPVALTRPRRQRLRTLRAGVTRKI